MSTYKSNTPLRTVYLFAASAIGLGIWQTGVDQSSWFLYITAITFIFGGITGCCPGLIAFRKVKDQ